MLSLTPDHKKTLSIHSRPSPTYSPVRVLRKSLKKHQGKALLYKKMQEVPFSITAFPNCFKVKSVLKGVLQVSPNTRPFPKSILNTTYGPDHFSRSIDSKYSPQLTYYKIGHKLASISPKKNLHLLVKGSNLIK